MKTVQKGGVRPYPASLCALASEPSSAQRLASRRAGAPNPLDALDERRARLLGLGREPFDLLDVPVHEHDGDEDLVVVDLEVVDAGLRRSPRRARRSS